MQTTIAPPSVSLDQHQIVAVNQLGLEHVAEDRLDLGTGLVMDELRFRAAVVGDTARDFASSRVETRDDFAPRKRAMHIDDTDRQKTLAAGGQFFDRAIVDDD